MINVVHSIYCLGVDASGFHMDAIPAVIGQLLDPIIAVGNDASPLRVHQ
jgi:hypothetical protein